MGGPAAYASRRRAPASPCRDCSADAPSRRESTLTGGSWWGAPAVDTHKWRCWWGGSGGALHVTFCPGQGGRIRAATPCASAQLQHLATQDRRRVVLFGLNDPHFPLFALKREA